MSNFITISSSARDSGNRNNFKIKFTNPIESIHGVKISKVMVPNTWYVIMSGINDKIYFTETTNWTATLTEGYYTTTTLATEIQTQMNSAYTTDNNFSCSFSTTTYKYTISHSATNFSLTFGTNTTASSAKTLGFEASDTSSTTSHEADNIVNLNYSGKLLIKCTQLMCRNSFVNNKKTNVIFPLLVNGNFGDNLLYESQGDDWCIYYKPARDFDELQFSLLFEDNETLVPLNGHDWFITLKFIGGQLN